MSKQCIALIFGGCSGEHEVSLISAQNVRDSIDKSKYDLVLVGISKEGQWFLIDSTAPPLPQLNFSEQTNSISITPINGIHHFTSSTKPDSSIRVDILFPMVHGTTGEDGALQGLFKLMNLPFVGASLLGSAMAMDKDICKKILKTEGIPVVPYLLVRKKNVADDLAEKIEETIGYPAFCKPANSGSSVGISKISTPKDLSPSLTEAFKYDDKVLIEKCIDAREIECAVLGHTKPQASTSGEVIPQHDFYSYKAKYLDEKGAHFQIPSQIPAETEKQIQEWSIKAFEVLELSGMARVDFFIDKQTNQVYLNEVNTIPGFTPISMYSKMWNHQGTDTTQLIEHLIRAATEKHHSID